MSDAPAPLPVREPAAPTVEDDGEVEALVAQAARFEGLLVKAQQIDAACFLHALAKSLLRYRTEWYSGAFAQGRVEVTPSDPLPDEELRYVAANAKAFAEGRDWPVVPQTESARQILRLIGEIRRIEEAKTHEVHHWFTLNEQARAALLASQATVAGLREEQQREREKWHLAQVERNHAVAQVASLTQRAEAAEREREEARSAAIALSKRFADFRRDMNEKLHAWERVPAALEAAIAEHRERATETEFDESFRHDRIAAALEDLRPSLPPHSDTPAP